MLAARWRLLALFVLLLFPSPASAQEPRIFYVSPEGDDAKPGTSPESAWKSVKKVNETPFKPGDRIRFQRGGQWRESLAASSSGSREQPIVYETYGEGLKPKFWGSDTVASTSF